MSVVARRMRSTPERDSVETWVAIVNLLAPKETDARRELQSVEGIAASVVSSESVRNSPMVMLGKGPRVRIYCLYDDEAVSGDAASENPLAQCPTDDEWSLSLPVDVEDLAWVSSALAKKSTRITARDKSEAITEEASDTKQLKSNSPEINMEAFLRS